MLLNLSLQNEEVNGKLIIWGGKKHISIKLWLKDCWR